MGEKKEVTAATRARKLVVAALCRDDAGRILVTQRRADQPMPLKWEFPGGKVEPGEAPVDALAREMREELGCDARVGRIDDVVFHIGSPDEGSRSISRIATESSGCSLPRACSLREAGKGPVVTRSSSTFGMSFAVESGAESGIVDLRCAS